MRFPKPWLLAAGALLLAVLAACGSDDNSESDSAAAVATTASDEIVAEDCLKGAKSYRYNGRLQLDAGDDSGGFAELLGDVTLSGSFVSPDRSQTLIETRGQKFETITIGADTWTRLGSGEWTKGEGLIGDLSLDPQSFCELGLGELGKAGVKPSKDKVRGVDALRYEFDRDALGRLGELFGSGSPDDVAALPENTKVVLWVTQKERWPVKITVNGERKEGDDPMTFNLEFTVTDLNKDSIKIEAPN
jgi:hypothetical protein